MDRRNFSTRLIAVAAASAVAAPALASDENKNNGSSIKFPPFGRIRINYGGQVYGPKRLIIVSDNFAREIGVKRKFQLSNENRSGMLDPTLASQFKDGVNIGDVGLVGRDIFIMSPDMPTMPGDLRLSDGEISFRINGEKLSRPVAGNLPILGNIPVLGSLFRRRDDPEIKRNLLVFLTPAILEYAE